jgi:hypothetical protein
MFDGDSAFTLYDACGFPLEATSGELPATPMQSWVSGRRVGVENGRFSEYVSSMSETQYEILEAADGTFSVLMRCENGADAEVSLFCSREEAVRWVAYQRRKPGSDIQWPEIPASDFSSQAP